MPGDEHGEASAQRQRRLQPSPAIGPIRVDRRSGAGGASSERVADVAQRCFGILLETRAADGARARDVAAAARPSRVAVRIAATSR